MAIQSIIKKSGSSLHDLKISVNHRLTTCHSSMIKNDPTVINLLIYRMYGFIAMGTDDEGLR